MHRKDRWGLVFCKHHQISLLLLQAWKLCVPIEVAHKLIAPKYQYFWKTSLPPGREEPVKGTNHQLFIYENFDLQCIGSMLEDWLLEVLQGKINLAAKCPLDYQHFIRDSHGHSGRFHCEFPLILPSE